jgi:ArsR family transcriptional regulator
MRPATAKSRPPVRRCCATGCLPAVARTRFDAAEVARSAAALAALGDETRLVMVRLLSQHEALCVCELQQAFDLGQPTISHHLRILREAGLVDVRRLGTWASYSLRRSALRDLARALSALV